MFIRLCLKPECKGVAKRECVDVPVDLQMTAEIPVVGRG